MSRISHRLKHLASVSRVKKGAAVNGKGTLSETVIAAALPCLAEGLKGSMRAAVFARIEQASFTLSWDPLADGARLQEQDLVTIFGRVFLLREILEDVEGGYFVGILQERK